MPDHKKENKTPKNTQKENIFDLTKLAPIELDHELQQASTIINIDEQNKLLEDYTEILRDKWDNLKVSDCIRYLRKDGSFRRGGFFKNSWVGTYGKQKGKKCMQIGSNITYKSTTWTICHDDIDKIWIKNNNKPSTSKESDNELKNIINTQQETIEYMTKSIEQLKIDSLKINNEQKRIINLIKKLHGIKSSTSR